MTRVPVGDGVKLYCQDVGTGPAVVLIHGGCMSHRIWESQVYALLDAGFRVITPDLRGHGDSDKPTGPYTAEMYAEDLLALVEELDIQEFALVGWSLGATVVARFARTYGDRLSALVLVSSNIFESIALTTNDDRERRLPLERMIANQRHNRPRGMEKFVSGMFGSDVDEWTRQWLWLIGMQTPMRVGIEILEIYREPDAEAVRDGLAALNCPGAVFHGTNDRSATPADAKYVANNVLVNGTFVPFEESGHVPFIEEAERFDEKLVSFLA